jgi:hypothetical protein
MALVSEAPFSEIRLILVVTTLAFNGYFYVARLHAMPGDIKQLGTTVVNADDASGACRAQRRSQMWCSRCFSSGPTG